MEIDLRTAINTISDVVQNRPPPIREFDQIYMKVADMAFQAEFVARRLAGLDVVFIGDGDGISLCVAQMPAAFTIAHRCARRIWVQPNSGPATQ